MAHVDDPVKERIITLTDAVVAIAMTLLILPLIEAAPEVDIDHVGAFFGGNWSLFLSFVISFLVIHSFWAEHRQIYIPLGSPTVALRNLNMLWLLTVAFIAFPTALIGRAATTSTVPFYLGSVLALCVLTAAITAVAARSEDPESGGRSRTRARRLWLVAGIVLVCMLVGLVNPDLGLWGMLVIAILRLIDTSIGRARTVAR